MANISLPYGKSTIVFQFPPESDPVIVLPSNVSPHPNPNQAVEEAINNPVDKVILEKFHNIRSVSIAINDDTRPVPHENLLPPLLNRLETMKIPHEGIKFIIALQERL